MAKEVLYKIKVNTELTQLGKLEKKLRELREEKKKLEKDDDEQSAKLKVNISEVTQQYNKQKKVVMANNKAKKGLLSQYEKESTRLNVLRKRLKDVILTEGKASRATLQLAKRVKTLDTRLKGVDAQAGQFQRNVGNYKSGLKGFAGSVAGAATASLGVVAGLQLMRRVVGDAINTIRKFEQGNANLASVLGTTKENIGALIEDAKRLGSVTSFSATQVTELQTEFAKLGLTENQILAATESTLNLAAATGTDLAEAAKVAGATLGGFGLTADQTGRVTDIMAKSFSTSALDMEKFKESMKSAAPAANAVGIGVEKTTALLGVLANAGITGSKAGNNLKTSFINLNAAGLTLDEGLEQVANSQDKLGTATKLVGKNAAASFLVLADGQGDVARLTNEYLNAEGAAKQMADTQLNTLDGSLKILASSWEGLILSMDGSTGVGRILMGMVKDLTRALSFLSGESSKVVKSQSQLNDESIRTLATSRENANATEDLADRYEELSDKENLNGQEKQELSEIMFSLIETFGESVAIINKETGALEINIGAVRKKILADRVLESQSSKDLLAEKARLEARISSAEKVSSRLETLRKQFGGDRQFQTQTESAILELINGAEKGTIELAKAFANVKRKFADGLGNLPSDMQNTINALPLGKYAESIFTLVKDTEELNKINEAFSDLGIDIDLFLETESEALLNSGASIDGNGIKRRKLTGLIEKQTKAISELQEQQKRTKSEEEIERLATQIRLAQNELDRLKSLADGKKVTLKIDPEIDIDSAIKKYNDENTPKIKFEFEPTEKAKKGLSEEEKKALKDSAIRIAQETSDAVFTIAKANSERRKQFELDQQTIINNAERDKLQARLDSGLISQEQFENDRIVLEKQQLEKRKAIEKEAFERQKRLDTTQAIINGALAITKTFAQYGFTPVGGILAAASAASTAIQVGVIQSQKFARGGLIQGDSHENGGVPIMGGRAEVEGGEAIINKKSTEMYGGLLSAINQAGGGVAFASGGVLPKYADGGILGGSQNLSINGLGREIANSINQIRVVNVATETAAVNNTVINIESDVSL